MSKVRDYLAEMDWEEDERSVRTKRQRTKPARVELVQVPDEIETGFSPTYHAKKHERQWILTYLGEFYTDHMISDVLHLVKGGKEATVYCCEPGSAAGRNLIAAKIYRPRMFRNLRNDAVYRSGRAVLDMEGKAVRGTREQRAMTKGTGFGQQLRHTAWLGNEFQTLHLLRNAGADVPRPIAHNDNAILMEYLGEVGAPAHALHYLRLPASEARPLFERVMQNVEIMLACNRIHADLSAHNILYYAGEIKLIDFPQAVNPYENPDAFTLFARDVLRVCQYFAHYGVEADATARATDLWARYVDGSISIPTP